MEAFTERIADVLERVGADLDSLSGNIFARMATARRPAATCARMIERIGFNGELNSKARESLVSLGRLLMFVQQSDVGHHRRAARPLSLHQPRRDLAVRPREFLGTKVSFLLEATLGLINVEQNNIIKIFSVAAVLFLPPTLIASIYGMNFHLLPDLPGKYGNFLFSIGLMIGSMGVTYALFKRKGWL